MLTLIRNRAGLVLAALVAALCPMLMAPTGGLPSRPTFQAVSIPQAYSLATCASAGNGAIFIGCDQSPLSNSTAAGKYAIKNFVDATGVAGGANLAALFYNRSTGTNAQEWIELGNDNAGFDIGPTSSTFSGQVFSTGGPSGKQFTTQIPTGYAYCVGRNPNADFCLDGTTGISTFPSGRGTASLTLATGCTTTPSIPIHYQIVGGIVVVTLNQTLCSVSGSPTTFTVTGIPSAIQSTLIPSVATNVESGGGSVAGTITGLNSGTWSFSFNGGAFSGIMGIPQNLSVTYELQ